MPEPLVCALASRSVFASRGVLRLRRRRSLIPRFPARLALLFNFMVASFGEAAIASGVPRRMRLENHNRHRLGAAICPKRDGAGSGGRARPCRRLTAQSLARKRTCACRGQSRSILPGMWRAPRRPKNGLLWEVPGDPQPPSTGATPARLLRPSRNVIARGPRGRGEGGAEMMDRRRFLLTSITPCGRGRRGR